MVVQVAGLPSVFRRTQATVDSAFVPCCHASTIAMTWSMLNPCQFAVSEVCLISWYLGLTSS